MKIKKYIISFFFILSIINILSSNITAVFTDNSFSNKNDFSLEYSKNYLIKFKDKPLVEFVSELKENLKNKINQFSDELFYQNNKEKIKDYFDKLSDLKIQAKQDIFDLLQNSKAIITNEYSNLFNGISIKSLSDELVDKIRNLPFVDSIFPDIQIEMCLDQSIPLIEADEVWSLSNDTGRNITGEGITIGLIDTGVDYNHPALGGGYGPGYKIVGGYDFINKDADPWDDNGHGTHCAGILLGVAPNVSIYAYKVLDNLGAGYASYLLKGLDTACDPNDDQDFSDHLDIVSLSLGTDKPGDPEKYLSHKELVEKVNFCVDIGMVVVTAAGNLGNSIEGQIICPGCAKNTICVGSSDKNDKISPSSSGGPTINGIAKPDVVAPGVSIYSTLPNNNYGFKSGTSMACPHVAGTVALLLQMHSGYTPHQVKMNIRNTAEDIGIDIKKQGWGRINAYRAVNLSHKPPLAILDTHGEYNQDKIDIHGTAFGENFESFSIYYQGLDGWHPIESLNENIVTDDYLATWDATNIISGYSYKIKLIVNNEDGNSIDYSFIKILSEVNDSIKIVYPGTIKELYKFNVSLYDEDFNPINAFVILRVPFHITQFKYGNFLSFKAPRVINPFKESLTGKLYVIKLKGFQIIKKEIIIKNDRFFIN